MEAWEPQAAASSPRGRSVPEPTAREWAEWVVQARAESAEAEPRAAEASARELALGAREREAAEPPSLAGRVQEEAPSRPAWAAPAADSAWPADSASPAQQAWVEARAACFAWPPALPLRSALARVVVLPEAARDRRAEPFALACPERCRRSAARPAWRRPACRGYSPRATIPAGKCGTGPSRRPRSQRRGVQGRRAAEASQSPIMPRRVSGLPAGRSCHANGMNRVAAPSRTMYPGRGK
jgi:hypothetical protein